MKINKEMFLYNLLLIGSLSIILFSSLIYYFSDRTIFKCNKFIVLGCNKLIDESSINNEFSYLIKKNIFSIDKKQIRKKLINKDFISSAHISIVLPTTVIFKIIEIIPISLIKTGNKQYIANEIFELIPLDNSMNNQIKGKPIIEFNNDIDFNIIREEIEFKFLKEIYSNHKKLYDGVSEIDSNEKNIIVTMHKVNIFFDSKLYVNQLSILNEFFKTIQFDSQVNKYKYIKFVALDYIRTKES